MKAKKKIKVIDLFAGCGGLTLGFENAGFEIVAGVDNWKPAAEVYKKNFGHEFIDLDLGNVETSVAVLKKYNTDMIIGGPPCQDFSQAGKRNEHSGRGSLTVSFAKIIDAIRPKYFVMENVDQLTKKQNFKEAYDIFKKAGYGVTVKLLDASFCGVPQARKRYFVIGEMDGEDNAVESHLAKNLSKSPMTVRQHLGNKLKTEFYYRHPWSYARRAVYTIDEPSPTIRGVNRPIPRGYPGHHLDATSDMSLVRSLTSIERS